jgi:hypothetical protein
MTKTINQDVSAFKDDFFKGLSLRECLYGGSALAAGAGGILFLHFYFGVNINAAITLCMPVIGIIGLCGFYQKNDMTLPEIVRSVIRLVRQKPFTYETGIFRNEMEDCNNAENKKGKHQNTGV